MIKSNLCDYSNAYILINRTIAAPNTAAAGAAVNNTNKKLIFKNCTPFTCCLTEINNKLVDYAEKIDIVMPMYNIVMLIQRPQNIYGNIIEMNQL